MNRLLIVVLGVITIITASAWASVPSEAPELPEHVYLIPKDTRPCPICRSVKYLIMQESDEHDFVTMRCANPEHFPGLMVISSGQDYMCCLKNWNMRGNACKIER